MIGMPLLAWLIAGWTSVDMQERLLSGAGLGPQLLIGAAGGLCIGVIAQWIVDLPFMQRATSRYVEMIAPLNLNIQEIIFISLCAGVGEEVLFRAAIQPSIGIWPTSVLFIALHGYISFKEWRISVYGFVMTGMIALLGYATETLGVWSAVAAHTVIDVFLLARMQMPSHIKWPPNQSG